MWALVNGAGSHSLLVGYIASDRTQNVDNVGLDDHRLLDRPSSLPFLLRSQGDELEGTSLSVL